MGIESYFLLKQQDDIPDFLYNKFLQPGGAVATKPTSTIILVSIKDSEPANLRSTLQQSS